MKNNLFADSISSFLAKFITVTVKTLDKQEFELQESQFNHKINLEKINDLKVLYKIYNDQLKNRRNPAARKMLTHAGQLLNTISQFEVSDLAMQIYEIQANLNLAYVTMNTYRG